MTKSQKNGLSKKVILITGASSGIGRATARALAKAGATIFAVGLNEKKLLALSVDAEKESGRIMPFAADISKPEKIAALCRLLLKKSREIDWIIHSAGTIIVNGENSYKPDWDILYKTFAVNTFATIYLNYKLKNALKKNGGIIAISSTAGIRGNEVYPIYSASKGGLNVFSKAFARYFEQNNKTLSSITICPGPTNTPMRERIAHDAKKHQPPEFIAGLIKNIILGRSPYRNGDIVIAKNSKTKILSRL